MTGHINKYTRARFARPVRFTVLLTDSSRVRLPRWVTVYAFSTRGAQHRIARTYDGCALAYGVDLPRNGVAHYCDVR